MISDIGPRGKRIAALENSQWRRSQQQNRISVTTHDRVSAIVYQLLSCSVGWHVRLIVSHLCMSVPNVLIFQSSRGHFHRKPLTYSTMTNWHLLDILQWDLLLHIYLCRADDIHRPVRMWLEWTNKKCQDLCEWLKLLKYEWFLDLSIISRP